MTKKILSPEQKAELFDKLLPRIEYLYDYGITGYEQPEELGFMFYHDEVINDVVIEVNS